MLSNWESISSFVATWYWLPVLLIYIGIILTILSENRNPSKSLAYILVLVFLPLIGLIVYYLVGRQPVFKKIYFDKRRQRDRERMEQLYVQLRPKMESKLQILEQEIGDLFLPFYYLYFQKQTIISGGNAVKLLINGEEKFPALFNALENATNLIYIEYYIFTEDDLGNRITDILIKKSVQGVIVRVIVDDVGSNKIKGISARLKKAGIALIKSMPVTFTSLANSNYRNHRKIVVIDSKIGFVGGMNLDERYWNNGKNKLYWRDTSIIIEGNAVKLLQVQFLLSWLFFGGQDDFNEKEQSSLFHTLENKGNAIISLASSGPNSSIPYIMEVILLAISRAKKSIRICTPYFIPNDQLTSALVIAAASGIEVELILPEKSDSFIVQHASFSFIKPLLQRGVKVYLYNKGFMHSKTISIDGSIAFVGTVNMDTRSFLLNFEITSLVHDKILSQELEDSFAEDKRNSLHITLEQWRSRSTLQRGFDSICRLVAPLL